jgi:chaperone required for assembly of F1-ATPase
MPAKISKRFYKSVAVKPLESGYGILLDDRGVRTPVGVHLSVPTEALAQAIAEEWDAQEEHIKPHSMLLTGMANTAIDRISSSRTAVIDEVEAYANSDLLCYWAEEPADLVQRQAKTWKPLLDWAASTFDAQMIVTEGIIHVSQSKDALTSLRLVVEKEADFPLTAVSSLTAICGSLIVALAVRYGRLDADQAFEVSQLEETHQIELWGEDYEAHDRRENLQRNISSMAQFLTLLES